MKIISCVNEKEVLFESDMYIPIDLKFGCENYAIDRIVYWRTGDFKRSLLEVGIGEDKGEIRSITLVVCDKVYKKECDFKLEKTLLGCPVVDLGVHGEKKVIDEHGELEVYIDDDRVTILFSKSKIVGCMKNANVEFLLGSLNEWIGVIVKNVIVDELEASLIK